MSQVMQPVEPVQYVQQSAMMYAAPPQQEVQYVNELGQPCTADGQLLGGEVQYVNELGQPCTADGQLLVPQQEVQYVNELGQPCTADGQPLGEVQYVNEFGQPCTADGQPLMQQVQYGAPLMQYAAQPATMTYAAPPVGGPINISPERFQLILQGQPLTNEEINAMTGAQAAPVLTMTPGGQSVVGGIQAVAEPTAAAVAVPAEPAAEGAATTSSTKTDKKKKSDKKKSALSSKKKSKGCC